MAKIENLQETALLHCLAFHSPKSLNKLKPMKFSAQEFVNLADKWCLLEAEQYLTEEKRAELSLIKNECVPYLDEIFNNLNISLEPRRLIAEIVSFYNWCQDNGVSTPLKTTESPLGFFQTCQKIT